MLRLEKAIGITYDNDFFLFQHDIRTWLRPISTWTYDGMHCLFANGIVSIEVDCIMKILTKLDVTYAVLLTTVQEFSFPDHAGTRLKHLLTPGKEKTNNGGWKGFASDTLLMFHFLILVLSKYSTDRCEPADKLAFACFDALWKVVGAYHTCKFLYEGTQPDVAADRLATTLKEHMSAHKMAYGEEYLVPKHHYCAHLPFQVRRDSVLLDAFCVERKTKDVKALATELTVSEEVSKQILVRTLATQIRRADNAFNEPINPQKMREDVFVATQIETVCGLVKQHDVILSGSVAWECLAIVKISGHTELVVKQFLRREREGLLLVYRFDCLGRVSIPSHLRKAAGWRQSDPSRLLVLDHFQA